jgi:NADPH:quinone reductase-like Zn-dependent oxidoreductase
MFTYEDAPVPEPADGEVLIAVTASGVTPTELTWKPTWSTEEGDPRPFPIIPGHEFSGVIEKLGNGVTGFAQGAAVFGMNDWFHNGAQAEYCLARTVDIAAKPTPLDHAIAALTPISALTAWQGLFDRAHLSAGERILIHGGAGSVGSFAVQLARHRGAHVISTASAHNLDFVRQLGANEVIDHRATPFETLVRDIDVVFDTVGGESLDRSWSVLKPGGRMVTIAASGNQTNEPRVRDAFFIVEPKADQLAEVARLIAEGELRPVVGKAFPLKEAREAYEHKPTRGKSVLVVRS